MILEREAKLAADPSFRLPDLSEAAPGVAPTEEASHRFVTSYFDTPDLRLTRWGGSLRYRTGEGWTVKLPHSVTDVVLSRQEINFDGPPGRAPAAALDLVSAYVRSSPVRLATRLQTRRHIVTLTALNNGSSLDVFDDEVSVLDGRRIVNRFREVEVELAEGGDDSLLQAVVATLVEGGARPDETLPKATRALRPASMHPPDVVVPRIGKRSTVLEVVRAAIAVSTDRLIRHDPLVRIGEDPEGLHQARVATRRLRSDLRTFRAWLVDEPREALREELRWLGTELGRVRDLDVLDERLRRHASATLEEDARGVAMLLQRLRAQWASAMAELLSSMREPRYLSLLDDLVESIASPPVRQEVVDVRAIGTLADVMEGPWEHLARLGERLGPSSTDADLHQARIRAKRVRYAAEALAPVAGKPASRFAKRAEALQTVLGEHQDAVMATAWLREQAAGTTSRVAFTAGVLAGVEARAKEAARQDWPSVWDRLNDRRLRFWT